MKRIYVAQFGRQSDQWKSWIRRLVDTGFEIISIDPLSMELQTCPARPGDTVLFDGLLPNLARYIQRICARKSDINIIVATEEDSVDIKYEVQHLNGAIYLSGPIDSDEFVKIAHSIVNSKHLAIAG